LAEEAIRDAMVDHSDTSGIGSMFGTQDIADVRGWHHDSVGIPNNAVDILAQQTSQPSTELASNSTL
jgi:hypothetical protein